MKVKKKYNFSIIFLLIFLFINTVNSQKNINYRWDKMLIKYVSENGNVNYNDWKKEQDQLKKYIKTLEENSPKNSWNKNDKLAYWINTYNAITVDLILDYFPVKSIKEIKNRWGKKLYKKKYSLGDIEHKILRKMNEPRIHFAINCASISCPKLLNESYNGRKLEKQLKEVTKAFLCNPKKNIIKNNEINLSRIFLWFSKDFGTKKEKISFISQYSGIELINPKVKYLEYNWSLNN